jgi:hypothetical protein
MCHSSAQNVEVGHQGIVKKAHACRRKHSQWENKFLVTPKISCRSLAARNDRLQTLAGAWRAWLNAR